MVRPSRGSDQYPGVRMGGRNQLEPEAQCATAARRVETGDPIVIGMAPKNDGPKQLTALYHHYREAFDEAHDLELQTGWTLHSSRRYLPDVVAKYEASDQQWIPETAIYATRSHACDY